MNKLLTFAVLFAFVATATAWTYVPRYCDRHNPDFISRQANQLGSLTTDPMNIVWKQNVTYMVNPVPGQTTYIDAVNFVYYQRQYYDEPNCRFVFEQFWNRGPGIWVFSKVESKLSPVRIGVPNPGGPLEIEARYIVNFLELLYDQAAALVLDSKSLAGSSNQLYNIFFDPQSGKAATEEVIVNLVDNQKRYYSLDFYDYSTPGLPVWGYFNSDAQPIADLPAEVQAAWAALDNGELVTINDPLADLAGDTFPVLAYVSQRRTSDMYSVPSVAKCHSPMGFTTKAMRRDGRL